MLRTTFRYALRHLRKNSAYTILNVFGLSIGLACFAMIGLWVKSELGYDRFHANAGRIYRVVDRFVDESSVIDQAVTSPPLAPAILRNIPEVEQAVRIDPLDNVMTVNDKSFLEEGIATDQSFFSLFDFKVTSGNRSTLLKEPYSIVLSESLAKKYFGDADPVGQLIKVFRYDPDGNGAQFKVTGVVEDCPDNSQFDYNFMLSLNTWETIDPGVLELEGWFNNMLYTYVLLNDNADISSVQSKVTALVDTYAGAALRDYKSSYEYFLQPFTDVHLHSNLSYEIGPTGSMTYVVIFATIGIIVLLLACINYINLSTAYATERFKEVGVHKVLGAKKSQLVMQYLAESWLLGVMSLVISFGWIEVGRPVFESVSGTKFPGLYSVSSIAALFTIASFVGIVAGFYPSFVLSAFKPVNILKGQPGGLSGSWLRKILVVAQFSITITLVIGIIVVHTQMDFIHNKDLGFDKNNLVVFGVHGSREIMNAYQGFVDELTRDPNIGGVTRSNTTIGNGLGNASAIMEDVHGKKAATTVYRVRVDYDYIDVYNMKIVAGRNFRIDNASDSTKAFIVNEATVRAYGYSNPADIIGKAFEHNGVDGQVIGVVKDFNFQSLQHKIEPACMFLLNNGFSRISIRINGDTQKGFESVNAMWKKHFPSSVIQYSFYEDSLAASYRAESRFSGVFLAFSIVSLAIACLGLFALVSYSVERRSKEIGIRKVLGATINNILSMLSREFLLLVALASIIAVPAGYYFMSEWLAGFAYHVSMSVFMFVGAGALVLVVAWITVSLRTFRAASSNPVNSLRSE
jgi:putative ABC transport system permease protein